MYIKNNRVEYLKGLFGDAENDLPSGESPYQQLVTDGNGEAVWEERLAWSNELPKVTATLASGERTWYKVSNDVPSFVPAAGESIYVYQSMEQGGTVNTMGASTSATIYGDDAWTDQAIGVCVVLGDSFDLGAANNLGIECSFTHGTWYMWMEADMGGTPVKVWQSGVAETAESEKEIPWDGVTETTKTIDPKYLPQSGGGVTVVEITGGFDAETQMSTFTSNMTGSEILEAMKTTTVCGMLVGPGGDSYYLSYVSVFEERASNGNGTGDYLPMFSSIGGYPAEAAMGMYRLSNVIMNCFIVSLETNEVRMAIASLTAE